MLLLNAHYLKTNDYMMCESYFGRSFTKMSKTGDKNKAAFTVQEYSLHLSLLSTLTIKYFRCLKMSMILTTFLITRLVKALSAFKLQGNLVDLSHAVSSVCLQSSKATERKFR
jgi:hypothetical protein